MGAEELERANSNRLAAVVAGWQDDTDLVGPEMQEKAPYYVVRILNGAKLIGTQDGKHIHMRSCGAEYTITLEAYKIIARLADRVKREELEMRGAHPPYNVEDIIRIAAKARELLREEAKVNPARLQVYIVRMDNGGCGFYRVMQPTKAVRSYVPGILCEQGMTLSFELGQHYDLIVAPRVSNPHYIGILRNLQEAGKIVVYETDDLLTKIPDWNPASRIETKETAAYRELFQHHADGLIVATEELKEVLGHSGKTYVCHNGIDAALWPMRVQPQTKGGQVRFLWGGSHTHEEDLALVVEPIKRILRETTATFTWINYAPSAFTCGYQRGGSIKLGLDRKWQDRMRLVPGCSPVEWMDLLARQGCQVVMAPLVPHEFNEAKSEIKVLEAWALGLPVIASDIAPYRRAITHDVDGLLVKPTAEAWESAMRRLIREPETCQRLAEAGLSTLVSRYALKHVAEEYEKTFLLLARGRIARPECNAAIETRLKEKGWA